MSTESVRELLNEHARSRLNGQMPSGAQVMEKLVNPVCGDSVELHIRTEGDELQAIGFHAQGCAICAASASLLRSHVTGQSISGALEFARAFETALLESQTAPWPSQVTGLACFQHLRINHSRRMCALLPWVVLRKALSTLKG